MIDLHCHLLPGVDDGPSELAESVELCRRAAADGCEVMVATPHQRHPYWWNDDRPLLEEKLAAVQERLGDRPRLFLGSEIHLDSIELLDEIQVLPQGSLSSLAGSRYLLLELSRQEGYGPDPEEVIHELLVGGWQPIIAHPEMYPWVAENDPLLVRLVEQGALLQVTAMSLTGAMNRRPRQVASQLLDAGMVHFVASDAHNLRSRPPGLSAAFRALCEGWGEQTAKALTIVNPRAVIDNRPLPGQPAFR